MSEVVVAAIAGAIAGVGGAYGSAALERWSKTHRNDVYSARDEPPVKDVVWNPHWKFFGVVGATASASLSAVGVGRAWSGTAAGLAALVLPLVIVVASLVRVVTAHRARGISSKS